LKKKDIEQSKIKAMDGLAEQVLNDNSWKQISNDVFRTPERPMLFSAIIGTGIQVNHIFLKN